MTGQAAIRKLLYLMTFGAAVSACISVTIAPAQERVPDYSAIISAPDRTEADLQTDKRRDPLKLLAFTGVRPGMKVLDMGAGGGYSTELMARAVAPTGVVYAQNPADLGERAKNIVGLLHDDWRCPRGTHVDPPPGVGTATTPVPFASVISISNAESGEGVARPAAVALLMAQQSKLAV